MGDAGAENVRRLAQPLTRSAELAAGFLKILAAEVTHLHPLQVPPDPIFGIHVRSVAGEALQVNAGRQTVPQDLLDERTAADCAQPASCNSHARRHRPSRQSAACFESSLPISPSGPVRTYS